MILNQNVIDTAFEARAVSEMAQKDTYLKQIEEKMVELRGLTKHIADIMDTYFYIWERDKKLSETIWKIMHQAANDCGLDFCNAIRDDDQYGVRINYANNCTRYTDLYITAKNVLTIKSGGFTMDYVRQYLSGRFVSDYESVYKAILFMIGAVPKYLELVSEHIDRIFSSLKTR